ncbi:NfeD family protein [Rhodoglobus vestalii]|nr:NfeD family protein [Rhodoglobus vestalii]
MSEDLLNSATMKGAGIMLVDLTQYLWILWLALVVIFIVIEVLTLEFTFLMIAAGTLIGGLGTNLLGGPWWLQIALAATISGLLIFTLRPVLLMNLEKGADPAKSNIDALYDLGGRVTGAFVDGVGEVKLDNGETWTARIHDRSPESTISLGIRVSVTAIEGATAVVVPATTSTPVPDPLSESDAATAAPGTTPPKVRTTKPRTTKPRATNPSPRKEKK